MTVSNTTDGYLVYLDKEMTIMGVLSAFSVILSGLMFDKTAGGAKATPAAAMWESSNLIIVSGCAAALAAGLLFYLQRSLLAWFYGQIVLAHARDEDAASIQELLDDADAWDTWVRYQLAFVWLYVAFGLFGLAAIRSVAAPIATMPQACLVTALFGVALTYSIAVRYVLRKYRLEDEHPWIVLWGRLRQRSE